jgi:hypothetical protein
MRTASLLIFRSVIMPISLDSTLGQERIGGPDRSVRSSAMCLFSWSLEIRSCDSHF